MRNLYIGLSYLALMTSCFATRTANIEQFMKEALELIEVGRVVGDWHPGYDPAQDIYITIRYNITHKNDHLTLVKYKVGNTFESGDFLYKAILHKKGANQVIEGAQYPKELELLMNEAYNHCENLIT